MLNFVLLFVVKLIKNFQVSKFYHEQKIVIFIDQPGGLGVEISGRFYFKSVFDGRVCIPEVSKKSLSAQIYQTFIISIAVIFCIPLKQNCLELWINIITI